MLAAGAYVPPTLPFTRGNEGTGEVGDGVAPGDRVAYVETLDAYAEERIVPFDITLLMQKGSLFAT